MLNFSGKIVNATQTVCKSRNVIEETTKVAVSYFKKTVVKLSKLCKKVGFDKIRTPEGFTLHLKKDLQPKLIYFSL